MAHAYYKNIEPNQNYSIRRVFFFSLPRCLLTDEWIKKLWYLYNGILLSHKKEWMWVSWAEMDESRAHYIEWSKSGREKQILHINTHTYI